MTKLKNLSRAELFALSVCPETGRVTEYTAADFARDFAREGETALLAYLRLANVNDRVIEHFFGTARDAIESFMDRENTPAKVLTALFAYACGLRYSRREDVRDLLREQIERLQKRAYESRIVLYCARAAIREATAYGDAAGAHQYAGEADDAQCVLDELTEQLDALETINRRESKRRRAG